MSSGQRVQLLLPTAVARKVSDNVIALLGQAQPMEGVGRMDFRVARIKVVLPDRLAVDQDLVAVRGDQLHQLVDGLHLQGRPDDQEEIRVEVLLLDELVLHPVEPLRETVLEKDDVRLDQMTTAEDVAPRDVLAAGQLLNLKKKKKKKKRQSCQEEIKRKHSEAFVMGGRKFKQS